MMTDLDRKNFQKILKNYQPSQDKINQIQEIELVLLLGFSGAGKNTIIQYLVKNYNYYFLISDTTRQPRFNNGVKEVDGQDYNFITQKLFMTGLKKGSYLEAELIHNQQVSGLNFDQIKIAKKLKKIAITDIGLGGANKILSYKENTRLFLILPPTFEVWLNRLLKRDQSLTIVEVLRRFKTAQQIIQAYRDGLNCQIIINYDYIKSAQKINQQVVNSSFNHDELKSVNQVIDKISLKIDDFVNLFSTLDS